MHYDNHPCPLSSIISRSTCYIARSRRKWCHILGLHIIIIMNRLHMYFLWKHHILSLFLSAWFLCEILLIVMHLNESCICYILSTRWRSNYITLSWCFEIKLYIIALCLISFLIITWISLECYSRCKKKLIHHCYFLWKQRSRYC